MAHNVQQTFSVKFDENFPFEAVHALGGHCCPVDGGERTSVICQSNKLDAVKEALAPAAESSDDGGDDD